MPPAQLHALTGLRFVAAAAVLVSHVKVRFALDHFDPGPIGSAAVGLFYVLSGFILSHVYRHAATQIPAKRFYLARFARIWPLHAVCLALACSVPHSPAPPPELADWDKLAAHITLLQAWSFDLEWAHAWNGPAWSLSVEAFFYLLFPILAARSDRTLFVTFAVCAAATLASYRIGDAAVTTDATHILEWKTALATLPIARLSEFLAGMCAHAVYCRWPAASRSSTLAASMFELLALGGTMVLFLTWGSGQWGAAWAASTDRPVSVESLSRGPGLSLCFALLIGALATGRGVLARCLATRTMVYLGEISFAVYMVHAVVFGIATNQLENWLYAWHRPVLAALLTTLGASAILYAGIEMPVRKALVLRGATLGARIRVAVSSLCYELRRPGLAIAVVSGIAGALLMASPTPSAQVRRDALVAASAPEAVSQQLTADCTLLGATSRIYYDQFLCYAALDGNLPEGTEIRFVTLTRDGIALHSMPYEIGPSDGSAASPTRFLRASSPLPALVGSSILQIRVCAIGAAQHDPVAGTAPIQVYRLPW